MSPPATMATINEFKSIEKFNGENFGIWKFRMEMLLKSMEIWTMVDGTEVMPEDTKDMLPWKIKNDKAMATICFGLKNGQLAHIRKASTAKEAWNSLEKIYETKNLTNQLLLRGQFFNCKMDEHEAMAEYISRVSNLAERLTDLDTPVTEQDIVYTILLGLPRSYNTLRTALELRGDKLDLESVRVMHCHQE
jgi:hypothetical protein